MQLPKVLDLAAVRALYAGRGCTPHDLIAAVGERIDGADPAIFITRAPAEMLAAAIEALLARAPEPNSLPLWGVPFAVKDNIDTAGLPTTCACPEFTRIPEQDAAVVARLIEAGAIMVGKQTSISSPPGSTAPARPMARRVAYSIATMCRAVQARARRSRLPPVSSASRWALTPPGRDEYRR